MTSGGKKKFLDPDTLAEAAIQVKQLADKENIHVALIGGFALQFYGSDRLTGDIDLVVDDLIKSLNRIDSLSFGGIKTEAPNGTPTDLVLRNDDYRPLFEEALMRARIDKDSPIPIVQSEHLAAMKMVAGRGKDNTDLEFLISSGSIHIKVARDIIKRHLGIYAADVFDSLVEEVKWKASRNKL